MVTYVKLTCQTKIHGEIGRTQTGSGRTKTGSKSQKTLEGHISLKTCSNQAFEVFFGIYRKFRCQKTPQTPNLDKFRVRYGLQKLLGLKTHMNGRRRVLYAHRQVQNVRKLWKVISHSKLVQIGRLRCFLASIENVDAKKHLKRPIQTSFE